MDEQDADIMAWAMGVLPVPQEWQGAMWDKFAQLDFVEIGKK
jgi:antitoxin CptB